MRNCNYKCADDFCVIYEGGKVVYKMELDNAVKSIFLQCLNEPDIIEAIKDKLNDADGAQTNRCLNENSNPINMVLIEKIDKILMNQKMIEDLIKSENNSKVTNQKNELLAKLENAKNEYDSQIKDITEKSKREIYQYKEESKYYQEQNGKLTIENESLKNENRKLITENFQ